MTQDVPALPGGSDGDRYRAWDGTMWPDPDSREVHNHTHPTGGVHTFASLSWTSGDRWGSIKR
jgi:hypothetical protein